MEKTIQLYVIIPVYNVERYIRRCFDSLCNQDYEHVSFIIIDDGSSDKSGEICDEYALLDKRFIVKHINNHGVSYARNFGLQLLRNRGGYLTFVDPDDFLTDNSNLFKYGKLYNGKWRM